MSLSTSGYPARVSVVIPCYNLGSFLLEAIDSCLSQTELPREIIVIDDGSEDRETRLILDRLTRPLTRVLRTKNRGLAKARNLGLRESGGEFVLFLDADDRLLPHCLAASTQLLDSHPHRCGASFWLKEFGIVSGFYKPDCSDLAKLLCECTIVTPACMRRVDVLSVGGYAEDLPAMGYEDWELAIRMTRSTGGFEIIPRVLFEYRRRAGSMVENCYFGDNHILLMRTIFDRHAQAFADAEAFVFAHQEQEITSLAGELGFASPFLDRSSSSLRERFLAGEAVLAKLRTQYFLRQSGKAKESSRAISPESAV